MAENKKLIIIDSNSVIHRAYHALPPLTTKKGELVNAVYGFLLVFFKIIKEFRPDFIVAAFDLPAPTFRHKKFKEYKAKRPPAPEDLYLQMPKTKEILRMFNVPIFEKEGFEADDLVGTIAKQAPKKQVFPEIETIIVSGDLDILQLINKNTNVFLLKKGVKEMVLYDEEKVKERYSGLVPKQLVDFKALRGDPSDNIPGVLGVGEKTAIELIKQFKTVEDIYKEIKKNSKASKEIKPKLKEVLQKSKEQVFFSKTLVTLREDAPIIFNLEESRWGNYEKDKVISVLENLEFHSLIGRIPAAVKETDFKIGAQQRLW